MSKPNVEGNPYSINEDGLKFNACGRRHTLLLAESVIFVVAVGKRDGSLWFGDNGVFDEDLMQWGIGGIDYIAIHHASVALLTNEEWLLHLKHGLCGGQDRLDGPGRAQFEDSFGRQGVAVFAAPNEPIAGQ